MSDRAPAEAEDGDAGAGDSDGAAAEGDDGVTAEGPDGGGVPDDDPLTAVRFVGAATAAALDESDLDVDAAAIRARRVSYRQLSEAGVNPGVAAKLRREHSLPWSFDSEGEDLDQRSAQIRGLGEAERAWVAASSGGWDEEATSESASPSADASAGDWTPGGWPGQDDAGETDATADGSGDLVAAETAWRERSVPEPVTTLTAVGDDDAERLAEAGITSVRSLATADPESVSTALGLSAERIRKWHEAAREHVN